MSNFAIVSALVITQFVFKGLCQDTGSCPGTIDVTATKALNVSKGICNVLFNAQDNSKVNLTFPDYKESSPNYIFVFDGPNCLAEKFDIVSNASGESPSYQSSSKEMAMLSGYHMTSQPEVAFGVQYSRGTGQHKFKTRYCGTGLTGDSGKLEAMVPDDDSPSAPLCVWTISTTSGEPTKLTVTKFDEKDKVNQLMIFNGTDCSGKNLLRLPRDDASNNVVKSETGQFVLLSFSFSTKTPFEVTWEKESKPTGATTPGSSTSIKGNAFWWLFLTGAAQYLEAFSME